MAYTKPKLLAWFKLHCGVVYSCILWNKCLINKHNGDESPQDRYQTSWSSESALLVDI
jgi:hypothetical protein